MKTWKEIQDSVAYKDLKELSEDKEEEMGKLRSTIRNIGVEELANVIKDALRGSDIKQLKKLI
tara:strand:+ start:245 stop:433 length:189 start_codon:yes stop_codon:yes gene_type:complete